MSAIKQFLIDYGTYRALGFSSVESCDFALMKRDSRAMLKTYDAQPAVACNTGRPRRCASPFPGLPDF